MPGQPTLTPNPCLTGSGLDVQGEVGLEHLKAGFLLHVFHEIYDHGT